VAVCEAAFLASLLAAPVIVVSAPAFAPSGMSRVGVGLLSVVGVAPAVLFTWLLLGVKILCAGS